MNSRRNIFKVSLILLFVFSLLFLSACASNSTKESPSGPADKAKNESQSMSYDSVVQEQGKSSEGEIGFTSATSNLAPSEFAQMIIYNGQIRMEVDDIKAASDTVMQTVNDAEGYLINSSQSENDYRYNAHFVFRVPVNGFQSLFDQITNLPLGKVTRKDSNSDDVTEEYLDLDARLKAKKVYEERLLDFLSKADNTEDSLKIFRDLERVQGEIEQIQGRQKYLKYHANFSTLTIDMEQIKNKVAPSATTWEKSVDGLKRSINFIVDLFTSLFIWFISSLPVLILLAILLVIGWKIRKRYLRNKQNNINE